VQKFAELGYRRPVEPESTDVEDPTMSNALFMLLLKLQKLANGDVGQDLVEYSLLLSLIALTCISGVGSIASSVNTVFSNISGSLA
jgi:Flp pilus assembly pilin Flp